MGIVSLISTFFTPIKKGHNLGFKWYIVGVWVIMREIIVPIIVRPHQNGPYLLLSILKVGS